MDLIENKPYTRPKHVLSRALSSAAKHRMLIMVAAPASSYVRAAAAAGVEPMELGLINHDDVEFEEQEQALCALMGEETIAETNMWEDPECQMFNAIDQNVKQTSLRWQCHKPGHEGLLEPTKEPDDHEQKGWWQHKEQQLPLQDTVLKGKGKSERRQPLSRLPAQCRDNSASRQGWATGLHGPAKKKRGSHQLCERALQHP